MDIKPDPQAGMKQSIDRLLAVIALHAGDTKENADHIHHLVAQDTMATAEVHLVSRHLTNAVDHINKALKELTATKIVLRSSGAS